MPKAKKTKSGKWKVTIYDYKDSTGKVHQKSFTADTKREAERRANLYKGGASLSDLTVGEAVKGYIDTKENVLSPSTHRAYMSIYRTHFETSRFGALKLTSLDNIKVQRFVSDLDLKPKSVRNVSGLLLSAIRMYMPQTHYSITLPAQTRPELHTPTSAEVEQVIEAIKRDNDRELYILVLLCAFGTMRRSEACAIRYDDIDYKTNSITIRRACVRSTSGGWIYKDTPKTKASYRSVICPSEVIKAIGRGFGYIIYKSCPNALSERFAATLKREGMQHFRIHDLRHYSASILHAIGIPDQFVMSRGGWASTNILIRVYRNALSDVDIEMQKKANDYFDTMMLRQVTI